LLEILFGVIGAKSAERQEDGKHVDCARHQKVIAPHANGEN
jgi:hypothetical protein